MPNDLSSHQSPPQTPSQVGLPSWRGPTKHLNAGRQTATATLPLPNAHHFSICENWAEMLLWLMDGAVLMDLL